MTFRSTKTFPPISCAFRQPGARSHCKYNHGYGLVFTLEFEAEYLDNNGWVVDFGSLKPLRDLIETQYDHVTVISKDDPHVAYFEQGAALGVLALRIAPAVGCEAFAKHVATLANDWLPQRVWVYSVECREHQHNSAIYFPPKPN